MQAGLVPLDADRASSTTTASATASTTISRSARTWPGTARASRACSRTRASTATRRRFTPSCKRDDLAAGRVAGVRRTGFGVTAALVTYPDLNPRAALFEPAALGAGLPRRRGAGVRRRGCRAARDLIARARAAADVLVRARPRRDAGAAARPPRRLTACATASGSGGWATRWSRSATGRAEARAAYEAALATPGCLDARATTAARIGLGDLALAAGDRAAAVAAYDGRSRPAGAREPRAGAAGAGPRRRRAADLTAAAGRRPAPARSAAGPAASRWRRWTARRSGDRAPRLPGAGADAPRAAERARPSGRWQPCNARRSPSPVRSRRGSAGTAEHVVRDRKALGRIEARSPRSAGGASGRPGERRAMLGSPRSAVSSLVTLWRASPNSISVLSL